MPDPISAPIPVREEYSEKEIKQAIGKWDGKLPDLSGIKLPKAPKIKPAILSEPPNTLNGAEKVEHQIKPESPALRLIVIKDYHGTSFSEGLITELNEKQQGALSPDDRKKVITKLSEQHRDVSKIQDSILETLKELSYKYGVKETYKEASSVETYSGRMALLDDYKRDGISMREMAETKLKKTWEMHDRAYTELKAGRINQKQYLPVLENALKFQSIADSILEFGAVDRAYLNDVIKTTAPSEIAELHQRGREILSLPDQNNQMDKIFYLNAEMRESSFLRIAHSLEQNGDKVACLVIGGAHEFKDNVELWNQANPNQKIALTVVSPKGYTEMAKKAGLK